MSNVSNGEIQIRLDADPDEVFAPDAFAKEIGKPSPWKGNVFESHVLIAAEVIEDGRASPAHVRCTKRRL